VFNIFLQILDDGRVTDNQGRTVDFKNTVIIMTSNIGAPHLLEGITADGAILDKARNAVMGELRGHFRPEFLNRVDEIVVFHSLDRAQVREIVDIQLVRLQRRLADRKLTLAFSDAAKDLLAEHGYDPVYGARPLKRVIQNEVETPLAQMLIAGDVVDGSTIEIDVTGDGRLGFAVGGASPRPATAATA
ncbi:MAG TPA: AAA family ATPase, partial [Gemmatimonadaceae bacterium]